MNFENKYDVQSKMSNLNFENGFDVSKLSDLRIKIITLRNDDAPRHMIDSAVIIICQRFLFVPTFTNLMISDWLKNYLDLTVDNFIEIVICLSEC